MQQGKNNCSEKQGKKWGPFSNASFLHCMFFISALVIKKNVTSVKMLVSKWNTPATEENFKSKWNPYGSFWFYSSIVPTLYSLLPARPGDLLEINGILYSSHHVCVSGRDVWIHRIIQIRRDLRRSSVQPPAWNSDYEVWQSYSRLKPNPWAGYSMSFRTSYLLLFSEDAFLSRNWLYRNCIKLSKINIKASWKIRGFLWNSNPGHEEEFHYSRL